ncbi:NAD-P-binding protein [Daedaleopsis nitida]|nr:NAD-P-binding protein [Daedaleopsis nitida]
MTRTTYAVIGASRGIGLEFVRQLAARPDATVFAVVRNASASIHLNAAVKGLQNVHILEGDVGDYNSLKASRTTQMSELSGGTLDCLIHNAARLDSNVVFKGFDDFDDMAALDADFTKSFQVNALGVIHSITAFLPLLRASTASPKKIVVISTGGADYERVFRTKNADMVGYCATKAAGLMVTTKWALKLKDEGFVVTSLNPGMVDTTGTYGESGDPEAHATMVALAEEFKKVGIPVSLQTPAESVALQLKVVDTLNPSDNGLLLDHHLRAQKA